MDDLVFEMVKQVIQSRKDSGVSPTHATFLELNNQIRQSLDRLNAAGRVKVGDTINDKYFDLV